MSGTFANVESAFFYIVLFSIVEIIDDIKISTLSKNLHQSKWFVSFCVDFIDELFSQIFNISVMFRQSENNGKKLYSNSNLIRKQCWVWPLKRIVKCWLIKRSCSHHLWVHKFWPNTKTKSSNVYQNSRVAPRFLIFWLTPISTYNECR